MFHALTSTCENDGCVDKTAHVGTPTAPLMCRFLLAGLVLVKLATLITCDTETASDKSRPTLLRDASTYMSCCIDLTSTNLADKQPPAVDDKFQDKKEGTAHRRMPASVYYQTCLVSSYRAPGFLLPSIGGENKPGNCADPNIHYPGNGFRQHRRMKVYVQGEAGVKPCGHEPFVAGGSRRSSAGPVYRVPSKGWQAGVGGSSMAKRRENADKRGWMPCPMASGTQASRRQNPVKSNPVWGRFLVEIKRTS